MSKFLVSRNFLPIPFLALGGLFMGLTFKLNSEECDNKLMEYGKGMGGLFLGLGVLFVICVILLNAFGHDNNTGFMGLISLLKGDEDKSIRTVMAMTVISALGLLVAVGLQIYGAILLFGNDGLACKNRLWTAYTSLWTIVWVLMIAGGVFVGVDLIKNK